MTTVGASPQLKRWKRTHREESSTRARGFRSRRGASPRARARRRPPWRSRRVSSCRGDATVSPGPLPSACVPPYVSTRLARKRATWEKSRLGDFFPAKIDSRGRRRAASSRPSNLRTNASARAVEAPAPRRALFSSDALVTVHRRLFASRAVARSAGASAAHRNVGRKSAACGARVELRRVFPRRHLRRTSCFASSAPARAASASKKPGVELDILCRDAPGVLQVRPGGPFATSCFQFCDVEFFPRRSVGRVEPRTES